MIRCGSRHVVSASATWNRRLVQMPGGLLLSARQVTKRSFAQFQSASSQGKGFFAWYSARLDTHPITTKCISAGLISSLGNVLAQGITYYQEKSEVSSDNDDGKKDNMWKDFSVDAGQVGRFTFLNVIVVAPVLHYWYNFINRVLPGQSIKRVLARTFWDEFVFSPIYIPIFLGALWKVEGTPWPKIQTMMVKEVPGIIIAEWTLWVPTMLVTFRYAPVKFQVLVINVVGVVWQTFLSFMAARAHASDHASTNDSENTNDEANLYLESVRGHDSVHKGGGTKHPHADTSASKVKATSPVAK